MENRRLYTRRQLGKLALAALPLAAAARVTSKIHGVEIGVAAYSYNTLPREGLLDVILRSMTDSQLGDCLLYAPPTEPVNLADKARPRVRGRGPVDPNRAAALEALRQWHLKVPLSFYTAIRKRFAAAGLEIATYEPSFVWPVMDEDIDKACQVTKALGAKYLAEAFTKSVAKRVAPISDRYGIKVAFQGRPFLVTDPDAMRKPADFEEVFSYSKNFGSSIDTGDATAGGWDVLKFIEDTHDRVFSLNLKDRTKAGVSVPWGEGDAPLREVLQLIRNRKYPVRCYIDCDYATAEGGSRLTDIQRCYEFAKTALA